MSTAVSADLVPAPALRPPPGYVDERAPRFAAWVSAVLLLAAWLPGGVGLAALVLSLASFAIGALWSPSRTPAALLWRELRRRGTIAPPPPGGVFESLRPLRAAQSVGLLCVLVALAGSLAGLEILAGVFLAAACGAALLNATTGFCLGCRAFALGCRVLGRPASCPLPWRLPD